jgi:hypothetical protein
MAPGPDLALSRALLVEKCDRLRVRDRTLLQSIVAFDIFVGPQLLAVLLGLPTASVHTSLSKLRRAGLIRTTPEGEVGMTYRVLRDILPASWRQPNPLEALRMALLLIDNTDWRAIARRAELYVLATHLAEAVGDFERAGVEAQHRGDLKDAARLFALAVRTAKAAINDPDYVRDLSSDEDSLEHAAQRCRARTKAVRLRIQRAGSAL